MDENPVIDGYAAAASALIEPYEALSCEEIYQHVIDLMPDAPARVLDIGAGTGRDAAWLAAEGYAVTAVEPVAEFRAAGQRLHPDQGIVWKEDRLPSLAAIRAQGGQFDMLMLGGVWHHLSSLERTAAWRSLLELMAPGAVIILSLRHGPGPTGRRVFAVADDEIVTMAHDTGVSLLRQRQAASIQPRNRAMGVRWTWFALRKEMGGDRP